MVYAEFSFNFEAITPVTGAMMWDNREEVFHLSPGEQGHTIWTNYESALMAPHYFREAQAFDIDENFPIIPQIVEAIYDSDNLPTNKAGFYIKSGLIKVKIVDDEDYVTQNQSGNERVLDMFRQDDNKIIVSEDTKTKITAFGDVMEFQSKLNSAIKQRYELLNTNFIINYNQTFPQVLQ